MRRLDTGQEGRMHVGAMHFGAVSTANQHTVHSLLNGLAHVLAKCKGGGCGSKRGQRHERGERGPAERGAGGSDAGAHHTAGQPVWRSP